MTSRKMKLSEFVWRISEIAKRRYRLDNTSDLLVIYFLKFVSDNQENLSLQLDKLQNFNVIARSYGRETNKEDFIDFCREIEMQLNIEQYGVTHHFTRLLNSITDTQYFSELLNCFLEEDFTENLQECLLVSCLLDFAAQQSGKELGACVTLGSISSLMACIGDVKNGKTLWDGYCGYGRNLVEVIKINREIEVYANEINSNIAMSAAMIQIMCFSKRFNICSVNSISTSESGLRNKIDIIMSTPPFGISLRQEEIEAIYLNGDIPYPELLSKRADLFFVQQAISKLSPNGLAIMQLPMGCLFQSGKVGELRKVLVENGHIKAVIQLPNGCAVGTSISTCIVVFMPAKSNKEIVLINAASHLFLKFFTMNGKKLFELNHDGINQIKSIIDNGTVIENISVSVSLEEVADKEFLLTPDVYTKQREELVKEYKTIDGLVEKEKKLFSELNIMQNTLFKQLEKLKENIE